MFLDFWHGETIKDVKKIDCFFSDLDCIYKGNMYDKNNNIIGDYSTSDSLKIEKTFEFFSFD